MKKVKINTEYITLTQLLKIENLISTGGMAKIFLLENKIYVNDILDNRRGRKLYKNDVIRIENKGEFIIE